jgi:hypothetical protein
MNKYEYLVGKVMMGMFAYGFLRGVRAEYPKPHDVLGYRMGHSVMNGICYLFPPHGICRILDLVNRLDVKLSGKNPDDYPSIYIEMFGLAKNKHILF